MAVRGRPIGKQVLRFAQDDKGIGSRTVINMRLIILAEESGHGDGSRASDRKAGPSLRSG